jgi:hypothetical protein
MGRYRKYSREEIIKLYKDGVPQKEILKRLGCAKSTVQRTLWAAGVMPAPKTKHPPMPITFYLVNGQKYHSRLRRGLLREKLMENKCSKCGISEWCGEKIQLHLHHKNGIKTDNRLENLSLLCPNCHSLTDTYCRRNIGKYAKV